MLLYDYWVSTGWLKNNILLHLYSDSKVSNQINYNIILKEILIFLVIPVEWQYCSVSLSAGPPLWSKLKFLNNF